MTTLENDARHPLPRWLSVARDLLDPARRRAALRTILLAALRWLWPWLVEWGWVRGGALWAAALAYGRENLRARPLGGGLLLGPRATSADNGKAAKADWSLHLGDVRLSLANEAALAGRPREAERYWRNGPYWGLAFSTRF